MINYYLFKEAVQGRYNGVRKVSQKEFAKYVEISQHEFDIKFYDYKGDFIGWQEIIAL